MSCQRATSASAAKPAALFFIPLALAEMAARTQTRVSSGNFKPRKPSEKSTYKLEPDVKFLTDLANKIASLTERAAALVYKMRKASV